MCIKELIKLFGKTGQSSNQVFGELPSSPDIVKDVSALYEGGIYKLGDKRFVKKDLLYIPCTLDPELILSDIPNSNSMDGAFDYGHTIHYLKFASVDMLGVLNWIADTWFESGGMLAADCVYRVMANPADDVWDFTKPNLLNAYAIHRVYDIDQDQDGRYWTFKGINPITNPVPDPYKIRDSQILYVSMGVIY